MRFNQYLLSYHVIGNVLDAEGGDRACSVEQNKDPTLTELIFLCVWEIESLNKIEINEKTSFR